MLNHKIGLTATELFACNPYRILGIPVDASQSEIDKRYEEFIAKAENGEENTIKTPFDFESLPPFSRDIESLRTAYVKLASNGYKCFAFSDSQFTVPLNIDDVALNLRKISCYDCFLRCYMWLVINDNEMEEHELWISLAKYMDSLISLNPSQFSEFFDHRFNKETSASLNSDLASFYETFSEIILLPLKELVRGSIKCRTAFEILKIKGIDVSERFQYIEIPQANLPQNGESEPLLKIALKDGDEYLDSDSGKGKSVENNSFDFASTPFAASEILKEPDDDLVLKRPTNRTRNTLQSDDFTFADNTEIKENTNTYEAETDLMSEEEQESGMSKSIIKKPKSSINIPKTARKNVNVNKIIENIINDTEEEEEDLLEEMNDLSDDIAPTLKKKKKTTRLISSSGKVLIDESKRVHLTDIDNDEENIYATALVKMLRANKRRNISMKEVDVNKAFNNGDNLAAPQTPNLEMKDVSKQKYDEALLESSYGNDDINREMTREEKYSNIRIDDMLNPMGNSKSTNRSFSLNSIDQFNKNKKIKKSVIQKYLLFCAVLLIFVLAFLGLTYFDLM